MTAHSDETTHVLDTKARPAACSCGKAKFAGSPTFVKRRHAAHVANATVTVSPTMARLLGRPTTGDDRG